MTLSLGADQSAVQPALRPERRNGVGWHGAVCRVVSCRGVLLCVVLYRNVLCCGVVRCVVVCRGMVWCVGVCCVVS